MDPACRRPLLHEWLSPNRAPCRAAPSSGRIAAASASSRCSSLSNELYSCYLEAHRHRMPSNPLHHKFYLPYNRLDRERLQAPRSDRKSLALDPTTHSTCESVAAAAPVASPSKPSSGGDRLLRPEDELNPWYTTPHLRNGAESRKTEDQRVEDAYKDSSLKSSHDPLKTMAIFLARRKASRNLSTSRSDPKAIAHSATAPSDLYEPDALRATKFHRKQPSHPHSHRSRGDNNSVSFGQPHHASRRRSAHRRSESHRPR